MKDTIKKILDSGVQAPSGSNSQPWRFSVRGKRIHVEALPEKDHPVLNFRNRGTWVAHGALIENISIAALEYGYTARIELFPDRKMPHITAKITLEMHDGGKSPLFPCIGRRTTNRKPYEKKTLNESQKNEFLSVLSSEERPCVRLIDGQEELKSLGEVMSVNEIVMFENRRLHNLFFKEIIWSDKDRTPGLLLDTLELKPPQKAALRIFRYWQATNLLNKLFSVGKKIARDNARSYASTSAIGAILAEDDDTAFINAGRTMERLWLKSAEMGLSFHPVTGVLFLRQVFMAGLTEGFSNEHIHLVKEAYGKISSICGAKDERIVALLFRLGYGGEPTATSFKLSPNITFED